MYNECVEPIGECLTFFEKAMPERNTRDLQIQLAVHLEQIVKLMGVVTPVDALTEEHFAGVQDSVRGLSDRLRTIQEQVVAVNDERRLEYADLLADQIVTSVGLAYIGAIDIQGALLEVADSNLSKFDAKGEPILDDWGRITKGPHYRKASLEAFI